MRLLIVADPMLPVPPRHYGGIERIIDMLCREYVSRGHEVLLVAHPESHTSGELVALPGLSFRKKTDLIKNSLTIARATSQFKPHVVHSFGRLIQLLPLFPLKVSKIMSYQREPHLPGIARATQLARKGSLLFTGCSDYISKQLVTVAPARTVYNGVPLETFTFRESITDDAALVFLGRLEQIKGVHNAIEIARSSGRRLIIAGNIPSGSEYELYFRERVEPFLDDRIEYIGPVDDSQKNKLLGEALALVMAIEWNEPFGIVMAEALACGTPILGTPLGAVREVVQHGVNGVIAPTSAALSKLVPDLLQISRAECRHSCVERFSDRSVADSYLTLYGEMCS